MAKFRVAGLDGSKSNFGVAIVEIDTSARTIEVVDLLLVKTQKTKEKQVRKSSDNLVRAMQITEQLPDVLRGCVAGFAEVPSGGQSYDAVLGFGIVIGIYAGIEKMAGVPLLEVSPGEAKMAAVGTRTASKQEMIEWATDKYPGAPWRLRKLKGEMVPTNDNEHLADAVAIVHAGIKTPAFKQVLAILSASSAKAA